MNTYRREGQIWLVFVDMSGERRHCWVGEAKTVEALRKAIKDGTWVQKRNGRSSKSNRRRIRV